MSVFFLGFFVCFCLFVALLTDLFTDRSCSERTSINYFKDQESVSIPITFFVKRQTKRSW